MTTMNVSLPEDLKAFVDRQVDGGGYGSTSEFVRDLIRREQDRQHLRTLLLDGAASTTSLVIWPLRRGRRAAVASTRWRR